MEKGKIKVHRLYLYRAALVSLDILFIIFSSYFALAVRFVSKTIDISKGNIPAAYFESVGAVVWVNVAVTLCIFVAFRLYSSLWEYAGVKELLNIVKACVMSSVLSILIFFLLDKPIFRSYFFVDMIVLCVLVCISRFSYRLLRIVLKDDYRKYNKRRTMIIGAGEACNLVMRELNFSSSLSANICCVIDDDVAKQGLFIHGVKIIGGREKILEAAKEFGINEIIVAMPRVSRTEVQKILEICQQTKNCELKVVPGIYQLVNGEVSVSKIRNVQIEDLLEREVTPLVNDAIGAYVANKVVLVTGGGGSIGSELCRQIAANGVEKLIIFDIYENNAYEIERELRRNYPNLNLVVLIGSVRNGRKLENVFKHHRPHIVYHAAAHKHVPLMETSPNEAIKNNVFGTYKTALAADIYKAEKFILISTDKAVNPTNIMGASKRLCEMVIQTFSKHSDTEFAAVRFGNVLGSNGSVIPLFKKQIEAGGPVTVTHPDITRYFMTIPEAVSLVLQAGGTAQGGEIFVLDMGQPVKIAELAKKLIRLSGYELGTDMEIIYTGLRPGEKLYEELLMSEEGLTETTNKLIYIGKPIAFDEAVFLEELNNLYREAYAETEVMKEIVHKLVPTYKIREEDVLLDQKEKDSWKQEYTDHRPSLPQMRLVY